MKTKLWLLGIVSVVSVSAKANFADRCMGELTAAEKKTVQAVFKATGNRSEFSWESCEAVEAAVNQKNSLDLSGQNLSEVGILAEFSHLRVLDLAQNHLTDLSALSAIKELRILIVSNNHLKSVEALAESWNLAQLDITNNLISDLGPLRNLEWLRSLNISKNQVADLSAISYLTHLQFLWAADNKISEVASLAGLWDLRVLSIAGNPVKDFSSLAPLEVTHNDSSGESIKLEVIGKPKPVCVVTHPPIVLPAPCGPCGYPPPSCGFSYPRPCR